MFHVFYYDLEKDDLDFIYRITQYIDNEFDKVIFLPKSWDYDFIAKEDLLEELEKIRKYIEETL